MSCPPADQLLEFAAGQLGDDISSSVEQHIDSCPECRGVLSNMARGDVPPSFGRYRIDTVLGSGGMGIVYRAYDPQLARPLAIKVVRRAADDSVGRARLVREAQALARLSHPNVCHVYDVGTEDEEVWVAMELIDGVTLRQWAEQRRTRDEMLPVLLGAAEGIAAAHAAGLVHRDIKPENVLVTRDGRAIVTDFGLARAEDIINPNASTLPNDPHLTATGAIAGTPAYLAPEQLTGDPIDHRVDQFAWAVMAWEMLVGARPFPIIFAARIEAVRIGITPPPTLPRHIAAALVRAMAEVPANRFPSMRDLIEALRSPAPARRMSTRTRTLALAGTVAVASGALAFAAWQREEKPRTSDVGPRPEAGSDSAPRIAAAPLPVTPSPSPSTASPSPSPLPASATATGSAAATGTATATGSATVPATVSGPAPGPGRAPGPAPAKPTKQPALSAGSASAPPAGGGGTNNTGLTPRQQSILDSMDPPYSRGAAIASMDAFCHIPYDALHPDPALPKPIVDWGRVVSVTSESGQLGDRPITDTIITVAGQRKTYRFSEQLLVGRLSTQPGALLAVCPESTSEIYQLSGGPTDVMRSVVTLSAPPRITELAKLQPLHTAEIHLIAEGLRGKLTSDPTRRYLIYTKVHSSAAGGWQMDRWKLDVPPSIRGANLVADNKRLWVVVEDLAIEDLPDGKHQLTARAAAVLDDLFPL